MEQVPRMGILAAMIFHLAAVCACLGVIIMLSETCALAFPGGGLDSFTHIELNFPISQVPLQECEYFKRHISSVNHLDFYLLTDGYC